MTCVFFITIIYRPIPYLPECVHVHVLLEYCLMYTLTYTCILKVWLHTCTLYIYTCSRATMPLLDQTLTLLKLLV